MILAIPETHGTIKGKESPPVSAEHGRAVHRLTFEQIVDKVFWAVIIAISGYVANQAQSINTNIQSLNEKVAAILATTADQEKRIDVLESRISRIEQAHFRGPSSE